jgi:hypothetical protein
VFCRSDLWIHQGNYFAPGEYLLADSAYPISPVTVPVIKGAAGLTVDGRDFNRCVANLRATNEHAIGMLKGRWRSLTQLPVRITKEHPAEDLTRALDWIAACAILHNYLIEEREILYEGLSTPHREVPAVEDMLNIVAPTAEQLQNGKEFRRYLMPRVLAAGRAQGGIIEYLNRRDNGNNN